MVVKKQEITTKLLTVSLAVLTSFWLSPSFSADSTDPNAPITGLRYVNSILLIAQGRINLETNPQQRVTKSINARCPLNYLPYAQVSIADFFTDRTNPELIKGIGACVSNVRKMGVYPNDYVQLEMQIVRRNINLNRDIRFLINTQGSTALGSHILGGSGLTTPSAVNVNYSIYCYPQHLPPPTPPANTVSAPNMFNCGAGWPFT